MHLPSHRNGVVCEDFLGLERRRGEALCSWSVAPVEPSRASQTDLVMFGVERCKCARAAKRVPRMEEVNNEGWLQVLARVGWPRLLG